jgi:hypothetical protein
MGQIVIGTENLSFVADGFLNNADVLDVVERGKVFYELAVVGTWVNGIDNRVWTYVFGPRQRIVSNPRPQIHDIAPYVPLVNQVRTNSPKHHFVLIARAKESRESVIHMILDSDSIII